jgi:hypothetical protein
MAHNSGKVCIFAQLLFHDILQGFTGLQVMILSEIVKYSILMVKMPPFDQNCSILKVIIVLEQGVLYHFLYGSQGTIGASATKQHRNMLSHAWLSATYLVWTLLNHRDWYNEILTVLLDTTCDDMERSSSSCYFSSLMMPNILEIADIDTNKLH